MYEEYESGGSSNVSSSSSPSLLTNLRHFRFQKKVLPKITTGMTKTTRDLTQDSPAVIQQPRRKIARLVLTDDEDEPSTNLDNGDKTPPSSTSNAIVISDDEDVNDAEKKLTFLQEAYPNIDKMILQDKLICSDWNVELTMSTMCNSPNKKNGSINEGNRNGENQRELRTANNHKKRKKRSKRNSMSGDSEDEDGKKYSKKTVYDSSDSDVELNHPSEEQKEVLQFLSNATDGELMAMPNCSAKKVQLINKLKPFKSWKDLVHKLQHSKGVNTSVLDSAHDALRSRVVVDKLMKKCVKLATQMETAVASGVTHITEQPANLTSSLQLAGYQLVGLNWLITMHEQGLNGILADEMGLGKTVQVIALLAHLQSVEAERDGPHLIVVPSSTLDNWRNELVRWCPSLSVVVYYGSPEERKAFRVNWVKNGHDDVDVILTTYNIVVGTAVERNMFRSMFDLDYLILDEAHMLKNMATSRYDNLMRIKAHHRVLLTGTPLQNTLLELMSLLIFVMPHMFSGKEDYLKSLFSKAVPVATDGKAELSVPRFEQSQVAQARRIMKPFVLRRLKTDVLKDLPPKTDKLMTCSMSPRQRQKYQLLKSSYSQESQTLDNNPSNYMTMMMQLRKLANHPALLRYHYTSGQLNKMAKYLAADMMYKSTDVNNIRDDLEYMSDFELHQMATSYKTLGSSFKLPDSVIEDSGKFRQLDELLPALKKDNHRVLIFSQFVIMLDVLEGYLKIRKHRFLRLDGSTAVPIRQELIDEFNNDPSIFVFLLSTRAGGLGINLTAADTVLIHDMDFNPYNDKQAEDRCHRMGQTRHVTVIRMVTEDSIEEGIQRIAQEKLNLEQEINSTNDGPSEAKHVVHLLKQELGISSKTATQVKPS